MRRRWNWPIWAGFAAILGGLFSYGFLVRYPITRDFPWANLLLFGIGIALLLLGLFRAFGRPQVYRSRFDPYSDSPVSILVFQLRDFLRLAAGSGIDWGAACWATGTRLFPTGSKWKTHWPRRSAPGTVGTEVDCADFLSRILVTTLQLRVAEFPAKAWGV
jgi:hypothetical protein